MNNCVGAGYSTIDGIVDENGGESTTQEIEIASRNFKQMKVTIHLLLIHFINGKKNNQQVH